MQSERLYFQKFQETDYSLYWKLASNDSVMKHITGEASTEIEAKEKFDKILKVNKIHPRLGVYIIRNKKTHAFVGLGKMEITKEREAELGYLLLPENWGQGYGHEIASYLISFTKTQQNIEQLIAVIDPENTGSRRILEKNDFLLDRMGKWKGLPAAYYKRKI